MRAAAKSAIKRAHNGGATGDGAGAGTAGVPTTRRLAASYARKSTPDEAGVADQHVINSQKAAAEGFFIPDSPAYRFSDDDITGTTASRKEFTRMFGIVLDAETAPFERLYVKDRSRFGRWDDTDEFSYWVFSLKRCGISVRFADETDLEGPNVSERERATGGLLGFVKTMGTSGERRAFLEKVRQAARGRVMGGFYPGAKPPYGLERWFFHRMSGLPVSPVDETMRVKRADCSFRLQWATDGTKEIVSEIFDKFGRGASMSEIAVSLNARRVMSPGERQRSWRTVSASSAAKPVTLEWRASTVVKILRNPIYRGDLLWSRGKDAATRSRAVPVETAIVEARGPLIYSNYLKDPPVSRDDWQAAQRRLDSSSAAYAKKRKNHPDYPLSSLLRCAACGRGFFGHTSSRKARYYKHDARRQKRGVIQCRFGNRYVAAAALEPSINALLDELLAANHLRDLARAELARLQGESVYEKHTKSIAKFERERDGLSRRGEQAALNENRPMSEASRKMYRAAVEQLGQQIEQLTGRIDALRNATERVERLQKRLDAQHLDVSNLRAQFAAADNGVRKRATQELIESVLVDFDTYTVQVRIRVPASKPGTQHRNISSA